MAYHGGGANGGIAGKDKQSERCLYSYGLAQSNFLIRSNILILTGRAVKAKKSVKCFHICTPIFVRFQTLKCLLSPVSINFSL